MKGDTKFSSKWILCSIAVALALLWQIVTVSGAFNMPQTCAQVGKGYIANPNDCRSFGYCNNSVLVGVRSCPAGHVYNSRRPACEYPSAGVCSVGNVCEYAADRSHVANPEDCTTYYYCEKGSRKLLSCPAGQVYNSRTSRCTWRSQAGSNVCAAESICRLVPDGKFVGDPDNCGLYISCINGVGTRGKCQDGMYFNKALGGCQPQNPCNSKSAVGLGPGVADPLPNNPNVCKGHKTYPAYVADGVTCMGYYVCQFNTSIGIWRKCNLGLHFNDGKCVTPYTFECKFDRCGNMKQEFVGAINSGCRNYLTCTNQTATYGGLTGAPCPAENPFFNEYEMKCLPTSPASDKYKLCGP